MKIPERTNKSMQGLEQLILHIRSKRNSLNMTMLEIGSWTGLSTVLFSKWFKKVYAIDAWEAIQGDISSQYDLNEVLKIFNARIKLLKNVSVIRTRSENLNIAFDIDICYIDGGHDYNTVKNDIAKCKEKTKIICGHDYNRKFPDVVMAVNDLIGKPDKIFPDSSFYKEL